MSDLLYATRLRFEGSRGVAKLHGRREVLTEAPQLPGLLVVGIDYVPEIGRRLVQTAGAPSWRDMVDDEVRAEDAVLRVLVAGAASCAGKSSRNGAETAPNAVGAPGAHL